MIGLFRSFWRWRGGAVLLWGLLSSFPMGAAASEPPVTLFATTTDGWRLALHHYRPPSSVPPPPGSLPVIVCHGISSNRYTWALDEEHDLGRFLSDRGMDTFLLELRGSGDSQHPKKKEGTRYGWTVDDHILLDAPAAVGRVLEETGAAEAIWIGHSMGGMIALGYLERHPEPRLGAVAVVGSPVDFRHSDRLIRLLAGSGLFPRRATHLNSPSLLRLVAGPAWKVPFGLTEAVYARGSLSPSGLKRMMKKGVDPISGGVLRQFIRTVKEGAFVSADGAWNYLKHLVDIRVPALFIAGRADNLAPPERVLTGFRGVASEDRTWQLFGIEEGHSRDYGHVDLCNGDGAPREVYPFLWGWLKRQMARRGEPPG